MNKKGAELTVGTIVIIVLAIIVLVVLVLGFTGGWGNLWERLSGIFGGGANIDSIKQACQVACTTQGENDYCVTDRSVVLEGGTKVTGVSCAKLSALYPELGVSGCDAIDCGFKCIDKEGWDGKVIESTARCDMPSIFPEIEGEEAAGKEAKLVPDSLVKGLSEGNKCCVAVDKFV